MQNPHKVEFGLVLPVHPRDRIIANIGKNTVDECSAFGYRILGRCVGVVGWTRFVTRL